MSLKTTDSTWMQKKSAWIKSNTKFNHTHTCTSQPPSTNRKIILTVSVTTQIFVAYSNPLQNRKKPYGTPRKKKQATIKAGGSLRAAEKYNNSSGMTAPANCLRHCL